MSSVFSAAPCTPLPPRRLGPVEVGLGALGVAGAGDGDDDVLGGDQVLHRHVAVEGDQPGAPLVAVLVDDLVQLVADDLALPAAAWPGCR